MPKKQFTKQHNITKHTMRAEETREKKEFLSNVARYRKLLKERDSGQPNENKSIAEFLLDSDNEDELNFDEKMSDSSDSMEESKNDIQIHHINQKNVKTSTDKTETQIEYQPSTSNQKDLHLNDDSETLDDNLDLLVELEQPKIKRRKSESSENGSDSEIEYETTPSNQQGLKEVQEKGFEDPTSIIRNQHIMEKCLVSLDTRLESLEKKMEETLGILLAQNRLIRENKVICQRTHHSVGRVVGEVTDETSMEISSMFPIDSVKAMEELEEKLKDESFEKAVKMFLWSVKATSTSINDALKMILKDECSRFYNMDGRVGKKSLSNGKLFGKILPELYLIEGKMEFDRSCRRFLEQSKRRNIQKNYYYNKTNTKQNGDNKDITV